MRSYILTLFLLLALHASAFDAAMQSRHDSILSLITGCPDATQQAKSITSFGAKAGGVKNCKPAFEKAMKEASRRNGGLRIVVPEGKWFVKGPIRLVSNVTLEIKEGATILFSPDPDDYLPMVRTSWEGTFCQNYSPFIYAFMAENVRICGKGTINGNCADTFPKWKSLQGAGQKRVRQQDHDETPIDQRNYQKGDYLRPQFVQFFGCKNVTIEDIFLTNSPFWCIHLLKSENVVCRNLRYDVKLVNNDGIDVEMTKNVLIEGVAFDNGDDDIAIKSGRDNDGWGDNSNIAPKGLEELYRPAPSENIIIRNCHFKGLHGVVLGSEMSAGVQNVFVEDCDYAGYNKRAIYFKTNQDRGGFLRNIYMQNLKFGEVEDLFYITSKYASEGQSNAHPSVVSDVYVDGVTCEKVLNAAVVLQGTENEPLRNITFRNMNIKEAKIGFSSMYAPDVKITDCNIGGTVNTAPTTASSKDNLWR